VLTPLVQETPEVVLGEWDHAVQAFPPPHAQEPLTQGIGLGTPHWRSEYLQPQIAYALVELLGEDRIAVMNQETVWVISWDRSAQLLQRPPCRGVRGHSDVEDSTCLVFHDDKNIKLARGRRDHDAEVTRDDRLGMVADKRRQR
jgi:hypothetical protein